MNLFQIVLLLFYLYLKVCANVYNSSITDFSKCKVHYSRSEVTYRNFFSVTDKHTSNSSLTLDFHFSILAPRDAHILLSPSANIQRSDPVYEIVLGAGSNTFSDIRRLQKSAVRSSARTKNLLSSLDIRSFWLHVSNDGLIEIGKEGEELAFLSWQDPDPLPIEVFSFCTWPGVEAKWYYDCQREDGTISNSKEIEKPLSSTEKLKTHLLKNYDPYSLPTLYPDDLLVLYMTTMYDRIYLDEMKSKIVIHGIMSFQWLDDKISWDPQDFDNIEKLNFNFRELWLPDLVIYNSARGPGTSFLTPTSMVVNSKGNVNWNAPMHIEAWCDASGIGHWPNDEHVCEVQLGLWIQDKDLLFEVVENSSNIKNSYSVWEVVNYSSGYYLIPSPWKGAEDNYATSYVIKFTLRRVSKAYTTIYFAPLFVIAVSLLTSFWLSPVGPSRISIHCFQMILLSIILTKMGLSLPSHPTSAPYIVLLYSYGFIAVLIALLFSILLMNLSQMHHSKPLPYFLYRLLRNKYVKSILYVRGSKFSESYDKLSNDNVSTKDIDIEEMWTLLGIAIDRLLFLIYLLLTTINLLRRY